MSKKVQTHLPVLVPRLIFYAKMHIPQHIGIYLNVIQITLINLRL